MGNTLTKIDLHLIFHVKSTRIAILADDMATVLAYIGGIIKNNGGTPIAIGGMPDHIHILTTLPPTKSLSDFVRAIKANSSRWLHSKSPEYKAFEWQEGYGAFSVSPTLLNKTEEYINHQAEHHRHRSFREEYITFLKHHNIQYDEQYLI